MEFKQKKSLAGSKEREQLRELNVQYTECLAKEFLPVFLAGKQVNVQDYCVSIRERMSELDKQVYPNDYFTTQ